MGRRRMVMRRRRKVRQQWRDRRETPRHPSRAFQLHLFINNSDGDGTRAGRMRVISSRGGGGGGREGGGREGGGGRRAWRAWRYGVGRSRWRESREVIEERRGCTQEGVVGWRDGVGSGRGGGIVGTGMGMVVANAGMAPGEQLEVGAADAELVEIERGW